MTTVLARAAVLSAALLLTVPGVALACPVCFGQNDSPMAVAMNSGILFMLGVVAAVLSGFGAFAIYLVRRARLAASSPGDPQEGTA